MMKSVRPDLSKKNPTFIGSCKKTVRGAPASGVFRSGTQIPLLEFPLCLLGLFCSVLTRILASSYYVVAILWPRMQCSE